MKIWNALPTAIQNSLTFPIKKKDVKLINWKFLVFRYKISLLLVYYFTVLPLVKLLCYLDYHTYFFPLYSLYLNCAPAQLTIKK